MHTKINIIVGLIIGVFSLWVILSFVTIKNVNGWTCSYTGSSKGSTTWLGLISASEYYRKSVFEIWMEENGKQVKHNWIRTQGTSHSLFGGRCFSHSSVPAIYFFLPDLRNEFIESSSEEEIEAFLSILNTKDENMKSKVIVDIMNRMIEGYRK